MGRNMKKYDPELVEEVKLLKPTRVKVEGSKVAKNYKKGDVVKVSGNDKAQLLASGHGEIVASKSAKASE